MLLVGRKTVKKGLNRRQRKLLVMFCFIIFFAVGLIAALQFGVSIDEEVQRRHSLSIYKMLFPSVSNIVTDSVDFTSIPDASASGFYGVTIQLLMVAVEHLFGFELPVSTVMIIRHEILFIIFGISAIYFYKICRKWTHKEWIALIGTAIYVLCPRTFSQACFNVKDGLFLSLFTINLYYCIQYLQKQTLNRIPGLVISTILCVNTRIVGAVLLAMTLAVLFFEGIWKKKWKTVIVIVAIGLASIGMYILITPSIWDNPIKGILDTITTFSNYDVWNGTNYFMGEQVLEGNLPWYYLPVWIFVSIPVLYFCLAVIGAVAGVREGKIRRETILLVGITVIPLGYVMLFRPHLYNNWRHFLFIWVPIAVLAFIGIRYLLENRSKKQKIWVGSIVGLYLVFILGRMIQYHPYGSAYFNLWAEDYAEDNMEKEGMNLTLRELYDYVLAQAEEEGDKTFFAPMYFWGYSWMGYENGNTQFVELTQDQPVDYILAPQVGTSIYEVGSNPYYFYPREYMIKRGGLSLAAVYSGEWDWYMFSIINETEEGLTANINGIEWEKTREGETRTLTGLMNIPVYTNKIIVEASEEDAWKNTEIRVQAEDGQWYLADEIAEVSEHSGIVTIKLEEERLIGGVSLSGKEPKTSLEWRVKIENTREQDLTDNNPIYDVSTTAEENAIYVWYAVDNDDTTRWTSGTLEEGMTFSFTMKEEHVLSKIAMTLRSDLLDYPQDLKIYVSQDQEDWTEIEYNYEQNGMYTFEPVACKYVQLVIGDVEEDAPNWTIRELLLFEAK